MLVFGVFVYFTGKHFMIGSVGCLCSWYLEEA